LGAKKKRKKKSEKREQTKEGYEGAVQMDCAAWMPDG
jgi:hypothetical protein